MLAFKAAISFEMTRRQNDKRMVALHVEMKDMMSMVGMYVLTSAYHKFRLALRLIVFTGYEVLRKAIGAPTE